MALRFGDPFSSGLGLPDDDVRAARRRAQLLAGLSLLSGAGTSGWQGIPQALLGGFASYGQDLQETKKRRDDETDDALNRRYKEALLGQADASAERLSADADLKRKAAQTDAERARQLRGILAGSPYEKEAVLADVKRLEELANKLYSEQAEGRKPKDREIRSVSGYGQTQFVDPTTGEVLSTFKEPVKPDDTSAADAYMRSSERLLRAQIVGQIGDEEKRLRQEHLDKVGTSLVTPGQPTVPFPSDLRDRATRNVFARYPAEDIPPQLRDSMLLAEPSTDAEALAPTEDRVLAEKATQVLAQLPPSVAERVEREGFPMLIDALRAGYSVQQVVQALQSGGSLP